MLLLYLDCVVSTVKRGAYHSWAVGLLWVGCVCYPPLCTAPCPAGLQHNSDSQCYKSSTTCQLGEKLLACLLKCNAWNGSLFISTGMHNGRQSVTEQRGVSGTWRHVGSPALWLSSSGAASMRGPMARRPFSTAWGSSPFLSRAAASLSCRGRPSCSKSARHAAKHLRSSGRHHTAFLKL